MIAARLDAVIEGNDGEVDEEDGRQSDQQHREAFYRTVTIMRINISCESLQGKNVFVNLVFTLYSQAYSPRHADHFGCTGHR